MIIVFIVVIVFMNYCVDVFVKVFRLVVGVLLMSFINMFIVLMYRGYCSYALLLLRLLVMLFSVIVYFINVLCVLNLLLLLLLCIVCVTLVIYVCIVFSICINACFVLM